ncbi:MAG: cation-transporting P-type ATPase [Candidatus Thorarchaeota archaeon]
MTESVATQATEHEPAPYHSMPLDEVLSSLSVDPDQGLSIQEARERLERYGENKITKIKGSIWKVYFAPILNWLITIYLLSSFALLILALLFPDTDNEIGQATIWLGIVAVNALVAIFQQFRAQKKLEALEKLSAGDVRVIRGGSEILIPPFDVVPGDIIKLEQGDKIPVDARLITSSNLATNEASLTGESVPSTKDHNANVIHDSALSDRANMVYFGTYVTTGTAKVITTTTGGSTEIGKIQGELESLNTGDIPLRKKVNLLAKYLGIAAIVLMVISFLWQVFLYPLLSATPWDLTPVNIASQLTEGITRAMTIMPINIPLLTTIVLLTGVLAMAKLGVIIRDLSAVESLGRVSVICSDKTGTMTRNQMTVKFCWDTENLYSITGAGYEPTGQVFRMKEQSAMDNINASDQVLVSDIEGWKGLYRLIVCGGIDNDSELELREGLDGGKEWVPLGDPTDAALLSLFRKSGLDEGELKKRYKIIEEFPFESELKRMSKICEDGKKFISFVKGATEVLLPRCTMQNEPGKPGPMTEKDLSEIKEMSSGFAKRGYRVISLAYRELDKAPTGPTARDIAENDLVYLGFAVLVDPPREGVKEAVNDCHSAGIDVVMITGDSAATAQTIAEELNIYKPGSLAVEGGQIESLTTHEFDKVRVYARVNPAHKQVIVERFQEQGKVVAMTGDGVNDALALAMSDAGIAMGITGTDVAKEAADLVITDDSFASIVTGVHQGRGLFTKIRMMIYFYVAINLFESIIFFGALFILPTINILSTWQSLYLVVTTHTFPGLALIFDKISPRAMEEKPRDSEEIITRPLGKFMAINVILMVIGAVVIYALTIIPGNGVIYVTPENLQGFYGDFGFSYQEQAFAKATIMMLTVILLVESIMVLLIRRINMPLSTSIREPGIERFVIFLGLIYLAHLLLMYVPMVQEILSSYGLDFFFMPLTAFDWLICILCALPAILGVEIYKRSLRENGMTL